MKVPCKNIPTYIADTDSWTTTSFENQKEFGDFLFNTCFKEPGEYNLDEHTLKWNDAGNTFTNTGVYTNYARNTPEYNKFWDDEELKCRLGVIWKSGKNTWYLTRDYYFLLNYCPILNKEKGNTESFMSIRDVQLHMMLYEKIAECYHLHSCVLKKRQMAYEQPHSSLILGKDGWITMGEVQEGDEIRNPDGNLCKVIDKVNNGIKDIYKITLDDGFEIECGENHLWSVNINGNKIPTVITLKKMIELGLYNFYNGRKEYRYRIKNIDKIKYDKKHLPIDPYVLGVLIGDGSISNKQIGFTSYDEDLANKVFRNLGSDYTFGYCATKEGITIKYNIIYKDRFNIEKTKDYINNKYGCNPLIRELDNLNLLGTTSRNKFIPDIYKYASIEDRIALLQGLMDTDGYINNKGHDIHFTTTSKQLANDIWILIKELGLNSTISIKNNEYGEFYRVRIHGEINFEIFSIFRKKKRLELRNQSSRRSFKSTRRIINIEKLDKKEECSCIVVDNPNHLYITNGYTITHNSNCHAAKSLNFLWFENKKTIKWFASDEGYLDNVNGTWKMLDAYKNHINKNTDWVRVFKPGSYPEIQQKEEYLVRKGQWATRGNESTLVAKSLKKDVTTGVGGAAFYVFHEEGGVAPKADITLQYLNPALESGVGNKTGSFHIGGSVGDLDDCKPLKDFLLRPKIYEMFSVPTKWYDETGRIMECGLFIPTQYGMPQAVDEYGNSQVEKALEILKGLEESWKELPPEQYVLKRSQNPKTIKEAFAYRKVSFFNVQRLERRQKDIELLRERNHFDEKKGLLFLDNENKVRLKLLSEFKENDCPVEMVYPVKPTIVDKRGVVTIYEDPINEPGLYYAGVDSVEVAKTDTSDSLFSIYIYKRGTKKVKILLNGTKQIEYDRGKIVASYVGRFNNPDDTNEQGLMLLRLYNALAACERNKPNFINYCRRKGYGYLIARKSQLPFDKELDATGTKNDEFGIWSDSAGKLLNIMKNSAYEYLDSEIDTIHQHTTDDTIGKVIKTIRGYSLVDDYWLLEELKQWNEEDNFDRFIAFSLAIIIGLSRELDYEKTLTEVEEDPDPKPIIHKPKSMFNNIRSSQNNLLNFRNGKKR